MSNNHKREALLSQDLLKKLMIIVMGSIVAAYGMVLHWRCMQDLAVLRSQCCGKVSPKHFT